MAKVFSIASWNVEHFKEDPTRVDRVIDFVKAQNPDVFGLYEVEGATIFSFAGEQDAKLHVPDY